MTDTNFRPVFYHKETCPFGIKAHLFLLEAGLLDQFEYRLHKQDSPEEVVTKNELRPHFDKMSFPTVQYEPGKYMKESDDIIAYYAKKHNIDMSKMTATNDYINGSYAFLMFAVPMLTEVYMKVADEFQKHSFPGQVPMGNLFKERAARQV